MMRKRRPASAPPTRRRPAGLERPSTPAFSYYAQRSERQAAGSRQPGRQPEPAAAAASTRLHGLLQRSGLLLLLIAGLLLLISSLSLSTSPRVVTEGRSFLHPASAYQQAAATILRSSLWNRNKLTINSAAVEQQLQAKFPELSQVTMMLPLLAHRPVLYVTASQPALLLNSGGTNYVVDQAGKVLLPASQLPPNSRLQLPMVSDQTGLGVRPGGQVLTADNVSFITTVLAELAARHVAVSGMTLPAAASELDVRLAGQPYFVKFNLQTGASDARQQAGTFLAVQNRLAGQHITPGKYIDVRLDGRAYYL